jgi:hypothetical protein
MHVSSSLIHPERADAGERAVRRDAEVFLSRSGARLIETLRLAGGERGLALGHAFRDIVLDPGMPPSAWPVSDVLEALASEDLDIRCRTAGLRTALGGLLVRIVAAEDGSAADDDDRAPAGTRDAA